MDLFRRNTLERRLEDLRKELKSIEYDLKRSEEEQFVQVVFHGVDHPYTYYVNEPAKVGDYLTVFSPMTGKWEIVKVFALGRTHPMYGHKEAKRIYWQAID